MSDADDFAAFKNCLRAQANLDIEAWDIALWEPLKDLFGWWKQQSDFTKGFTGFLAGKGATVLARWLGRVAKVADAEVAVTFAEALIAVAAGIALGTFIDVAGRCIPQAVA